MDRRIFLRNAILASAAASYGSLGPHGAAVAESSGQPGPHAPALIDETGPPLDFSAAVVVVPPIPSKRERKAVQVLIEEIEHRTEIRLPLRETAQGRSQIVVGSFDALRRSGVVPAHFFAGPKLGREGYALRTWTQGRASAAIMGADERGVLFGVGGLLRKLKLKKNQILMSAGLSVATHPRYPLRGHQLGYRPKTNSYDGWTVSMWDQYIRDLSIFGTNAIELIPPRSDDQPDSPNFWLPPQRMMSEMSRICDDYGCDVWIWYPAMDRDYSETRIVERSLSEWGEVFRALPRIDSVFVPGGDPGHTSPKYLLALLEKQRQNLRRYHPHATMWVSPQSFDRQWMEQFFGILQREQPPWLAGVVFGPQIALDLPAFRRRLPARYPIRLYPDITHSLECQFPVPDWDAAYAYTEGREIINPRPGGYADIMRRFLPYSIGFISYSEGCNDDVNKCVSSALAWNPDEKVDEVLRDYARYFVGDQFTEGFAQGLLALEENWRAPLVSNDGVLTTLRQFQAMENAASPHDLLKWRMQQGFYRAYYDAYVQSRLIYETGLERRAMDRLEKVRQVGMGAIPLEIGQKRGFATNGLDISALLTEAIEILEQAYTRPPARDWRTRILELGEALYQSIRMQMAVERYGAEAVERGATLDTLDAPITNVPWLLGRLRQIRALPSREQRISAILEILDRTNPGPGGFYDDLGNAAHEPHLVRGLGFRRDPEFRRSALDGFDYPAKAGEHVLIEWKTWAASLYDAPLEMYYPNLDPAGEYRLRVVYAGKKQRIRLVAAKDIEIHGYILKPWPIRPLEFGVPKPATSAGELRLRWYREPGLGHDGEGCQVAEVWLMLRSSDRKIDNSPKG